MSAWKYTAYLLVFFLYPTLLSAQIECLDCHDHLTEGSVHQGQQFCQKCHPDIKDEEHEGFKFKPLNCGVCHKSAKTSYDHDVHSRIRGRVGEDAPDCIGCHGTHKVKSLKKGTEAAICEDCHDNVTMIMPFHSNKFEANETCVECHDDTKMYQDTLKTSVHQEFACVDCHDYLKIHEGDYDEEDPLRVVAECYYCHKEEAKEHKESIHGISLQEGVGEAAQCWDCHGSHAIHTSKDSVSWVYPKNLAKTCGKCHDDPTLTAKYSIMIKHPGQQYLLSTHGKLIQKGMLSAATCMTCHGKHDIQNMVQANSKISPYNIPQTCGTCHPGIEEEYKNSIHWIRVKKGSRDAPVCNDCHNEHAIGSEGPEEGWRRRILQEQTCMKCHQDPAIQRRYSLSGQAVAYQDSYHGLALMRGDGNAAGCVDCHGVHDIRPKAFEGSMVSEKNVKATCSKCHEDVTDAFTQSYSHESHNAEAAVIEGWVKWAYILLIAVVIGGMAIHNLVLMLFEMRRKRKKEKRQPRIVRLNRTEVWQHGLLAVSFIILAITGFALKYPQSWWSQGLAWLGMTETLRQWIHRACAIIMIIEAFYHVFYLLLTKRGRFILGAMIPTLRDVPDAMRSIKSYLGIKTDAPRNGLFDYTQKAEYWALVWGTIVMAVTGLILWFPTILGGLAPVWTIKVAEIVHFYEAILATAAIIVWHWFFVLFHPDQYPISFIWFDGEMTLAEFKHHHHQAYLDVVREYHRFKKGDITSEELSYGTRTVLDALKKDDWNPDEVLTE